jgi:hypothetical protein
MRRRLKIGLVVFFCLVLVAWVFIANPMNFFVRRSDRFSFEEFESIKSGTRIEEAVARLGKPIAVVTGPDDISCPKCTAYYFLGDPPSWVLSFREAWLLVDTKGRVVAVTVYEEP